MKRWLRMLKGRGQEGQGMVEYALVLVLVAVVVVTVLTYAGHPDHGRLHQRRQRARRLATT